MNLIVLAGGRSSRLGQDKTSVMIAGESLVQRIITRLAPLDSEVVVVFSQEGCDATLPGPKLTTVQDIYPGAGSLGGVYTGLMNSTSFHNLVVACDMPFLNIELLRYMMDLSPEFDAVVPRVEGKVEPLHAVYSKNCLPPISELLGQGDFRVYRLLNLVRVRYVEQAEIDRFDPEHLSFFNVNTKADLEKARELADAYS